MASLCERIARTKSNPLATVFTKSGRLPNTGADAPDARAAFNQSGGVHSCEPKGVVGSVAARSRGRYTAEPSYLTTEKRFSPRVYCLEF